MLLIPLIFLHILVSLGKTEDVAFWDAELSQELQTALNLQRNEGKAKNVIVFVGNGMGPNTVTATRIYRSTVAGKLVFEDFPYSGTLKTYSNDGLIPDSASATTAIFTGVKVNENTAGVTPNVYKGDCKAAADPSNHLSSVLEWAQNANMSTGFVTTSRVTADAAIGLYAHIPNYRWECDAYIPANCQGVIKDITRQLIEDTPGRKINVIMGGGKQTFKYNVDGEIDNYTCRRSDGIDLIRTWIYDKQYQNVGYAYVENLGQLNSIDTSSVDYILGLFSNQLLPYEYQRTGSDEGSPSLASMTEVALKVLKKNENGFFLMVEGAKIDFAHHRGHARIAIDECNAFNDAISVALSTMAPDLNNTLIIVTGNYAQSLTISGFAKRNADIFGLGGVARTDQVPFTILNYATGGPNNYQFFVDGNGNPVRVDPSNDDTTDFNYSQQTAINNDQSTHGGADVCVYAVGPMAHLFHTLHEQPYISRVIAYAAEIGPCSYGQC